MVDIAIIVSWGGFAWWIVFFSLILTANCGSTRGGFTVTHGMDVLIKPPNFHPIQPLSYQMRQQLDHCFSELLMEELWSDILTNFLENGVWVDHHHPPITKIASAPGAVLFNNRIHVVGLGWAFMGFGISYRQREWRWLDLD